MFVLVVHLGTESPNFFNTKFAKVERSMAGWIVRVKGVASDPVSGAVLKQMAITGEIDPSTLVRREDSEAWNPAGKIKGLFPVAPGSNDPLPSVLLDLAMPTDGDSSGISETKTAMGLPAEVPKPYSPPTIAKAISEQRVNSGKRRYRMIEVYAAVFRVLGIVVAVFGVLAALLKVAMNPPSLLDAIAIALGMIVGSALIAFSLLLASQMIKLVLDVAGDIKQIADRSH